MCLFRIVIDHLIIDQLSLGLQFSILFSSLLFTCLKKAFGFRFASFQIFPFIVSHCSLGFHPRSISGSCVLFTSLCLHKFFKTFLFSLIFDKTIVFIHFCRLYNVHSWKTRARKLTWNVFTDSCNLITDRCSIVAVLSFNRSYPSSLLIIFSDFIVVYFVIQVFLNLCCCCLCITM